jgi:hypothetical protein
MLLLADMKAKTLHLELSARTVHPLPMFLIRLEQNRMFQLMPVLAFCSHDRSHFGRE